QNQGALEASTCGVALTLGEQHAAEIVMGFRVVRLGRQHLLVEPDGLVRLSVVLVPDGLAEQTAGGLQRCSSGVSADALALHPHGSALLSVHPKVPAAGDQPVIAACACSVEQATARIGLALREMWEKKTTAHTSIRFLHGCNGSTLSASAPPAESA